MNGVPDKPPTAFPDFVARHGIPLLATGGMLMVSLGLYAMLRVDLGAGPEITLALSLALTLAFGLTLDSRSRLRKSLRDLEREKAKTAKLLAEVDERNRDLRTLLYVTSHDLREPLRSIRFFSDRLLELEPEDLRERGGDFLRRIHRAGERLDGLIEEILLLSRARRNKLKPEPVPAGELLDKVEERLTGRIRETGARLARREPLPTLRVDRFWGVQALYNLVANALKFTAEGAAPDIEIRGFEEKGYAGLVVADRGPGVDPAHAERIFEMFQRAVGREVDGTGAGLAIVRQVAVRHQGRAWVSPRPGGGSEFHIAFSTPTPKDEPEEGEAP